MPRGGKNQLSVVFHQKVKKTAKANASFRNLWRQVQRTGGHEHSTAFGTGRGSAQEHRRDPLRGKGKGQSHFERPDSQDKTT